MSGESRKLAPSSTGVLRVLWQEGFFAAGKTLAEIGHIYPVQTLFSIVFKMVRRRYLRRVKQNGRWASVR